MNVESAFFGGLMVRPFAMCVVVVAVFCKAGDAPDYRTGSLARQEPQAIYSSDLRDPWNRIFYLLFTRAVETRLSDDFKSEGPFVETRVMADPGLRVTIRTVKRIESGDRAIDPLYPNFFSSRGSEPILQNPGFSELRQALLEACAETALRPALQRALMQADLWAAYDILSMFRSTTGSMSDHARTMLQLLEQMIAKLALTSTEIAALPHNYMAAQTSFNLPHVFDENSGWMEVKWFPVRTHDTMGADRHAARIFLKPLATPQSLLVQVNQRIENNREPLPGGIRDLDGAVLLTQVLLIDRSGRVVPSPLVSDVQLRTTARDEQGKFKGSTVTEFELSRHAMFSVPSSGGFIHRSADEPAYLASSGNDFTFASPITDGQEMKPPIMGTLRHRCESCHGDETSLFSFRINPIPGRGLHKVRQLDPAEDEQASYVAQRKMERQDFKSLHLAR
jgi:hypothetical protein